MMPIITKPLSILCLVALLALPAACATDKAKDGKDSADSAAAAEPEEKHEPVEKMYNEAAAKLDTGDYHEAAKLFDAVDQQYPYSQWAARAQLMSGYSQYKELKYDEAVLALDRFISLHPSDENVAYAYYLKALCYYEQIVDVRRDQQMTKLALENLRQVKERFGDSRYAKDASLKIDLTMDHLAGKEMEIGRYYLQRKQFQAGINRFQKVITQYQTTTHVPEALHRLTESYLSLGMIDEAKKTAAILGHNYPNSSWYKDTYVLMGGKLDQPAPKKSVYDKTIGRIF
jgi:outer membrane protein assembly factor BamD